MRFAEKGNQQPAAQAGARQENGFLAPAQERQFEDPQKEIKRINSIKSIPELAGYFIEISKKGGLEGFTPRFGKIESEDVWKALRAKMEGLGQRYNQAERLVGELRATGLSTPESLLLVINFLDRDDALIKNSGEAAKEYLAADASGKARIAAAYAELVGMQLAYSSTYEKKPFLENDAVLAMCDAASAQVPSVLEIFKVTDRIRFVSIGGKEKEVLSVLKESLALDEEHQISAIGALGSLLSSRQDEAAKDLLLSFLGKLDAAKRPRAAIAALSALRGYAENSNDFAPFEKAATAIIEHGSESDREALLGGFFGDSIGFFSSRAFDRLCGTLSEKMLAQIGSIKSGSLLQTYQQFLLKAMRSGGSNGAQKDAIASYFGDFVAGSGKLGITEQFFLLVPLLPRIMSSEEITKRARPHLEEFVANTFVKSLEIGGGRGAGWDSNGKVALEEFYRELPEMFEASGGYMQIQQDRYRQDMAASFAERIFSELAKNPHCLEGTMKREYKSSSNAGDSLSDHCKHALAKMCAYAISDYKDMENLPARREKLAKLVSDMLSSEARFVMRNERSLVRDAPSSPGSEQVDTFFQLVKNAVWKNESEEEGLPAQMREQVQKYLLGSGLAQDGTFYASMLRFFAETSLEENRFDKDFVQNGLIEHAVSQLGAGSMEDRVMIAKPLLRSREAREHFRGFDFSNPKNSELSTLVVAAFGKAGEKLEGERQLYRLLGNKETAPELRSAILAYIRRVHDVQSSSEAAASVFRDESISYVERVRSMPEESADRIGADQYHSNAFGGESAFNRIAAAYSISMLEKGGLGLVDCYVFSSESIGRINDIRHFIRLAHEKVLKYEVSPSSLAKVTSDYESLRGRLLAVLRRDFASSENARETLLENYDKLHDALESHPEGKSIESHYFWGSRERGLIGLSYVHVLEARALLSDFAEILKQDRIQMGHSLANELLNNAVHVYANHETARDWLSKEELEGAGKQAAVASGRLDKIFCLAHLPSVMADGEARAFGLLASYVSSDRIPGVKTTAIRDQYDPDSRQGVLVLAKPEIDRLLSELSQAADVAQRTGAKAELFQYVSAIAGRLNDKKNIFILGEKQEQALFMALEFAMESGNTSIGLPQLSGLLLRNPKNRARLEENLLSRVGEQEQWFEQHRMGVLGSQSFNTVRVNSAVRKLAGNERAFSVSRSLATGVLASHGEKVDSTNFDSNSSSVREATATGFENNLKIAPKESRKAAEKNLDPKKQSSAAVRGRLADAVVRGAPTDMAEEMLKDAFKKEKWANWAATEEYFGGTIQLPIVRKFEKQAKMSDSAPAIQLQTYSYAKTSQVKITSEEGYSQICSAQEAKQFISSAMDNDMPGFLAAMNMAPGQIDAVMKQYTGLQIGMIASGSRLAGTQASGMFVPGVEGKPGKIFIDVDQVEREAKAAGHNAKYQLYDTFVHELLHGASRAPEMVGEKGNRMDSYKLAAGFALSEPLTEFFSTMQEIYASKISQGEEMQQHAGKIGISFREAVLRMNDAYQAVARNPDFINWAEGMGAPEIFQFYIRGDVDGLKKATDDRFGPGAFDKIFPPYVPEKK